MKKVLLPVVVVLVLAGGALAALKYGKPVSTQTPTGDKSDLIRVTSPLPNTEIKSPVKITGEARGNWFFEASFPVVLMDSDGTVIAQGHAEAKADWMTQDFVAFEATLSFAINSSNPDRSGTLILEKDNPSDLSEKDNSLMVPVILAKPAEPAPAPSSNGGVKMGESTRFGDISVTPTELVSDSRCGAGVVCVWAGRVEIKARIISGTGPSVVISNTNLTLGKPFAFAGKQITLEKVEPYPNGKTAIIATNYRFTFSVK